MTTVRSCGIMDCKRNDKAGGCLAEFIEIGERCSGGMGCMTFESDYEWLRGEFSKRMRRRDPGLEGDNGEETDEE